jgi:tetratricopeptide (TPR) repeat protein
MVSPNLRWDVRLDEEAKRDRVAYLTEQAHAVRDLLGLGTTGAGIARTHSVLLTDAPRMTKGVLERTLARAAEVDPQPGASSPALIMPYCGMGFYAGALDLIVVPLISTRSLEESIVQALADRRMTLDAMNHQGRLRGLYGSALPGCEFGRDFTRNYRNWVLGVGQGFRGSMEASPYEFFRQYVGPAADALFATGDMIGLTPDERAEMVRACRRRINRGECSTHDYQRLAILYWREGRFSDALDLMTLAVRKNPEDARATFALGYIHKQLRHPAQAKACFSTVVRIAPNSLWQVYASEQLLTV